MIAVNAISENFPEDINQGSIVAVFFQANLNYKDLSLGVLESNVT